ncbi:unnamed protein product [Boreogadus saida]
MRHDCVLQLAGGIILGVALWLRHDTKTSKLLDIKFEEAQAPSTFYIRSGFTPHLMHPNARYKQLLLRRISPYCPRRAERPWIRGRERNHIQMGPPGWHQTDTSQWVWSLSARSLSESPGKVEKRKVFLKETWKRNSSSGETQKKRGRRRRESQRDKRQGVRGETGSQRRDRQSEER